MARRRTKKKPVWPKVLGFVIACLIGGGVIGMVKMKGGVDLKAMTPWGKSYDPAVSEGLSDFSRAQLEREVVRLRAKLAETERENADLLVQMKLLDAGSRTDY